MLSTLELHEPDSVITGAHLEYRQLAFFVVDIKSAHDGLQLHAGQNGINELQRQGNLHPSLLQLRKHILQFWVPV